MSGNIEKAIGAGDVALVNNRWQLSGPTASRCGAAASALWCSAVAPTAAGAFSSITRRGRAGTGECMTKPAIGKMLLPVAVRQAHREDPEGPV